MKLKYAYPLMGMMAGLLVVGALGCKSGPDKKVTQTYFNGDYGKTRDYLEDKKVNDRDDRNYLLDRVRLGMAAMADGYQDQAEQAFDQSYTTLRTQGINEDRTVAAVIFNEDHKIWKGEPFEQALALYYIGLKSAIDNDWGNTRAATESALFRLKKFGGKDLQQAELVARAAKNDDALNRYQAVRSDFVLAYLLNGIANQQLGRKDEANARFHQAEIINPRLKPLIKQLREGDYNTLLFLDYGRGPQKIGTGPDRAIAEFKVHTRSDQQFPRVAIGRQLLTTNYPAACDVNLMATNHMWNNLEDVRIAKSVIGTVLLAAGAGTAAYGAAEQDWRIILAGLAVSAVGVGLKAGAHADTTYNEINPQRIYVVPLKLPQNPPPVHVMISGKPDSVISLPDIELPKRGIYVRYLPLMAGRSAKRRHVASNFSFSEDDPNVTEPWTTSTRVFYGNDFTGQVRRGKNYPYILGGDDVRVPNEKVLASYKASGYLKGMTLDQLIDLYRAEGIAMPSQLPPDRPGRHVLEGGKSLVMPLPGSIGFKRLFYQRQRAYQAKSQQVLEWKKKHGS